MKFFLGKRKCFRDESGSNPARTTHSVAMVLQSDHGCATIAACQSATSTPARPVEHGANESRVCGSSSGQSLPPTSNSTEAVSRSQDFTRITRSNPKDSNGSPNFKSEYPLKDVPDKENYSNMRMKNGTRDVSSEKERSSRGSSTSQQGFGACMAWAESGLASSRIKKGAVGTVDISADGSAGHQHSPFSNSSPPLRSTNLVPSTQLGATTASSFVTSPISVTSSAPSPLLLTPRAIAMCADKPDNHYHPTPKSHLTNSTSRGSLSASTDGGGMIQSRDPSPVTSLNGTNANGNASNSLFRSSIVSSTVSTRHAVASTTAARDAESLSSLVFDEPTESSPGDEKDSIELVTPSCKPFAGGDCRSCHSNSLEDSKLETVDRNDAALVLKPQQKVSKSSTSVKTHGGLKDDDTCNTTIVTTLAANEVETTSQIKSTNRRNGESNVNSSTPTAPTTTGLASSAPPRVSGNINSVNDGSSLSFDIEASESTFTPRRSLLTSTVGSCGAAPTGFADGSTGTVITADVEFVARRPSTVTERSNIRRTSATWTAVEDGAHNAADSVRNPFLDIPRLNLELTAADQASIVVAKLDACCTVYDFTRNTHLEEKEAKRATLLELVKFINSTTTGFPVVLMAAIIRMVTANIFRALPPPFHASSSITANGTTVTDLDEEDAILEASWPHLQVVYEFFLRFLISNDVDPKAAKRFIDQQFVVKFLELFSSEDPRERDYVKTILHRIYGKIMTLRSFIRKAMQHIFLQYIHYNDSSKGVAEMLEILGSIINGFALPLKEEHKRFLERSLIPLHKAKTYTSFNQQLTYCMIQYVEKDYRLAEQIIHGVLRYWPVTNTNKEVIFLNELEEILELTQPGEFRKIMDALFHRMALCIQSPHYQVSERVLFLWNNQNIVSLFNLNKQHLFPVIIGALYRNSKQHWNSTVHGLTYKVSKLLASVDPKLFDECSARNAVLEESRPESEVQSNQVWELLEARFQQATSEEAK